MEQGEPVSALWGNTMILTGLVASMVVNALVTGLIVFKILKVFMEVKPTSVEQTLGSISSTGVPKLRNIIFIIVESGMALFVVQLVRVVITSLVQGEATAQTPPSILFGWDVVIVVHEMLNVIMKKSVLVLVFLTDDIFFTTLAYIRGLHQR